MTTIQKYKEITNVQNQRSPENSLCYLSFLANTKYLITNHFISKNGRRKTESLKYTQEVEDLMMNE